MIIREIHSKTILSRSKVMDYTINPYLGCEHGCRYCYARFIRRFTGHREKWGEFVDIRVNAPELLKKEVRKQKGRVWISGLCDPYQPLEKRHELTRSCLQVLASAEWPVSIQTKSPLVLRDIDILKTLRVEVCITITTDDERIKNLFEPKAPSIKERIAALAQLHGEGIKTSAMIAPFLPLHAERLVDALMDKVDYILVDKMNYHYADWVYRRYNLTDVLKPEWVRQKNEELRMALEKKDLRFEFIF